MTDNIPTDVERLRLQQGESVRVRDDAGNEFTYGVTHAPWQLGHGVWVIGLEGISGGYSLDRVTQIVSRCRICGGTMHEHGSLSNWWCEQCGSITNPSGAICGTPTHASDLERLRADNDSLAAALRTVSDERARLYAALAMLAQLRHVSGSAQAAFRSNLRLMDAVLQGADCRDLGTVEAITAGTWTPKETT